MTDLAAERRIHSEEELQAKADAILLLSKQFSYRCLSGLLNESPQMLYSEIDSLHQLLIELRRG